MNRKISIILFASLLINIVSNAQTFRHPYSYYGLGELQKTTFIDQSSMGGLSIAYNNGLSYTPSNPASYSFNEFSTFNLALSGKIQNLSQLDKSYTTTFMDFGYFSLAFPISKKAGIGGSFGLMPVSKIGYKDETTFFEEVDSFDYTETYELSGGFSKFYLGASFLLWEKLSIGANVYYLFGNTEENHFLNFDDAKYNSVIEYTQKNYYKLMYDFGMQFSTEIAEDYKLTLGAVFSQNDELSAREYTIIQTYEHGIGGYKDSIETNTEGKTGIELPLSYGFGFMIDKKYNWKFGVDYSFSKWSSFTGLENYFKLNDQWEIIAGGEYTPDYQDISNYFKRINYRLGIKHSQSYLNVENSAFSKSSISLGAGFPLRRSISRLNFGLEFGKISSNKDVLINENYINIFIGFRLNDVWFQKSKIN
ncbi:MAG: hypothetical protein U9R42_11305 [Bacteroidota bacterium]|nr:hypothetical protein [Bacteroidota bacterium]